MRDENKFAGKHLETEYFFRRQHSHVWFGGTAREKGWSGIGKGQVNEVLVIVRHQLGSHHIHLPPSPLIFLFVGFISLSAACKTEAYTQRDPDPSTIFFFVIANPPNRARCMMLKNLLWAIFPQWVEQSVDVVVMWKRRKQRTARPNPNHPDDAKSITP